MNNRLKNDNLQIEILNTLREQDRFHHDTELIYVMEGSMEIVIGEYKSCLPREGIYVVDGNKNYSYQASKDILFARLTIPYQMFCRGGAKHGYYFLVRFQQKRRGLRAL